ncbi:O-antigen ligase family protein [Pararhizobium sp. LjRoot238]|uniref:O-antigen ligase family protein n=1 Tax=Pararhizobium sp. LjRoot238 TaxID=3342293 RepID=UPI003ED02EE2
MDHHDVALNLDRRTSIVTRMFIFAFCIVSLGGYRLQLAGIDPTQSFQGFSASYLLYTVDILCICWATFISFTNFDAFIRVFRTSLPLTLLPLMAIVSSTISVSPELTFFESVKYMSAFIVPATAVIVWYSGRANQLSYELLKLILLLSFLTITFFPKYGIHSSLDFTQSTHAGSWRGIFGHRTDLGYCCAVLLGLAFSKFMYKKRISDLFVLCVSTFFLYKTGSGGADIVAIFSIIMITFHFALRRESKNLKFSFGIILTSIAFFIIFTFISPDDFLSIIGEDSSFTGRVPLWSYIFERVSLNYVYGLGYIAGFDILAGPSVQLAGFTVPNAQGAYMESLIAFGFFGPILILILTIKHFIVMLNLYVNDKLPEDIKFCCFCISAITFFLILTSTVVESYLLQSNKILVGIIVILIAEISIFSGNITVTANRKTEENFHTPVGQGLLIQNGDH